MSLAVIDDNQQALDLTELEIGTLAACEEVIERNLKAFMETGEALAIIRDQRLYRASHGTFEDYCLQKWGFSDRRARMLIDASEVVADLKSGTIVPLLPENEAQARPLTPFETAEERQEVWQEAVETAPEGKVTAAHVQTVADRHTGKDVERAEVEAAKEAQAAALVGGFMDAPNSLAEPDEAAEKLSGEPVTAIDYDTSLAMGRCLAANCLRGEIGPQMLFDGKLWVCQQSQGGRFECLAVTEMDGWIDRNHVSPLHYTEWEALVEKGERAASDVTGVKVVWISAPRDTSCYFVLTGERRTFQFVARDPRKTETKAAPKVEPSEPEPKAVPQPVPDEPVKTETDTRSELEQIHATLSCRLDYGVLLTCRPEDTAEEMDAEAFVAYWLEFLGNVQQALANTREMESVLQARLQESRELVKALQSAGNPTPPEGEGIWVQNCDYKLLKQLAARKRPGQVEEMTPADYLTLMIEQRAAMAGIPADAGV